MSDYHVLTGGSDGHTVTAVFHIALSTSWTNVAGKTAQECLSEDPDHTGISAITVSTGEADGLAAGTLYEHQRSVRFHNDMSNAQKQGILDGAHTGLETLVPAELLKKYWAWGFERNVT